MGKDAWRAALCQLEWLETGHTYTLMVCKMAAGCPHSDVLEAFLLQLTSKRAGVTVLMGVKLVSDGRPLPIVPLLSMLMLMQSMPGKKRYPGSSSQIFHGPALTEVAP